MFNKIKLLITFLIKLKINFSLKKKKLLIFDKTGSIDFLNLLSNEEFFILNSRLNDINIIYLSRKILYSLFRNFFKIKFKLNYLIAVIKEINPEIVMTRIDNSYEFSFLANYFKDKIKFIAVQNASRGDIINNSDKENEHIFLTNYVCFSQFDIDVIKSKNIKVKKYFIGGSLRNSNFQFQKNKNNTNKKFKSYDICFVSKQDIQKVVENEKGRKEVLINLIENISKYIKKYNKSIIIACKTNYNKNEEAIYKEFFSGLKFKIQWQNQKYLGSYESIHSSKIVIGLESTLLREALLTEAKILLCDYKKRSKFNYPFSNISFLDNLSYNSLEKRLNLLFDIDLNEYYSQFDKSKNYYMANVDTNHFLKNLINNKKQLI